MAGNPEQAARPDFDNDVDGAADGQGAAFAFVQTLASDLSSKNIELPSFPDVVVRIRKALADEGCSQDQIVRIVGSEPTLAARLIRMANSAALRPAGKPITDLRMAIGRMGYSMVRSVAMSFALARISKGSKLRKLENYLEAHWKHSTFVAALSYVLAKSRTKLNPDEALLLGLMHGVGKLYILIKAERHPELFEQGSNLDDVLKDWHPGIGRAILEAWEFPEEMAAAVNDQENLERQHDDDADLTDVLQVANVLAKAFGVDAGGQAAIQEAPPFTRLSLKPEDCVKIIEESDQEIRELSRVLGR